MTLFTISRIKFIESHYSDDKNDFYEHLTSLWVKPLNSYINDPVYTFDDRKGIEISVGSKSTRKLDSTDIFDIMLSKYSVQDFMLIVNFTMRNRDKFETLLGNKLDLPNHTGLKLVLSEWKKQVNNPKTHDSLQELILQYRFRKKLEKELSKNNNQKSSKYIEGLTIDFCRTYSIVAKVQQVRRLRKGSSRNPGNIDLSDNIIANAWNEYKLIKQDNLDQINSHCIVPARHLEFLVMMQHHLNNNRRYNPRPPSFDSRLSNLEKEFGPEIKKIMDSKHVKPVWCEIYYWWYLRLRSKFHQRRLDRINQSVFDEQISQHKSLLTPQKQGYLKVLEGKEKDNLTSQANNDLIHGFKQLSNYLIKEMLFQKKAQEEQKIKILNLEVSKVTGSDNNAKLKELNKIMKDNSETKEKLRIEKLLLLRRAISNTNNKITPSEVNDECNETILKLMRILMSDGSDRPPPRTNIFITQTKSTKPICLEYDIKTGKYIALNLVPKNKSSLINNCRTAIKNANLAYIHIQSTNEYKSLILQIIVLIQLIIKLRVNLHDSRIYLNRFKNRKRDKWSDNPNKLEKDLFDEFSKSLISIFENIQKQLDPDDTLFKLLENWIGIIRQIPDIEKLENHLNPRHKSGTSIFVGRLGMLCTVLSSFIGLIDVSGDEQEEDKIILYTLTKKDFLKNPLLPIEKIKKIIITKEDLNLKPVGETSID
jgi:hypothetical protein